jgi:hypothetical protein
MTFQALILMVCTLACASLAQAQSTRTWVSGVGDDVNPCSRTAPCKTFAGAISKTFINGEINAIDSAGFGTITITKSITLDGAGVHASILASGVNGVNINIAANANDPLRNVILRNLSINGTGASGTVGTRTGVQGINVNTNGANNVWIEGCVVFNFSQNGYNQVNTTSSTQVYIKDSVFSDNGGAGVNVASNNGTLFVRVAADHSHFTGNQNGIKGGGNARIEADTCTLSGNTNAGVQALSVTAGLVAVVNVSNSQLSNNLQFGAQAGGAGAAATSIVRLGRNNVTGNATAGINISTNGEIDTYGDNHIFGNNIDGCPGCTPIPSPNS